MMRIDGLLSSRSRAFAILLAASTMAAAGCASAPAAKGPPPVPTEKKLAEILQLEDQRILRVPPPPPPPVTERRRGRATAPPAPVLPDLARLLTDVEPRIRRRAALAVGRVGLPEGVQPLTATLKDADPEVREMAAFALGLIGDASGVTSLIDAFADPSPLVRGHAAEALGLIAARDEAGLAAAKPAAQAIGQMAAEYGRSAVVASMQPDDETTPAAPEAEAFKRGIFALVRLRAYDALAVAVLDASGRPVSTWWPIAYALQRVDDKRAVPALRLLLPINGRYTPAFAARGLGRHKDAESVEPLLSLVTRPNTPLEVRVSVVRALGSIGDGRAAAPLAQQAINPATDPNLRLEIVSALGTLRHADGLAVVQDLLTDDWPMLRAAALKATAAIDQESFVLVLSGFDPDRDWRVRAAVAETLGTLPGELAGERLHAMLQDEDKRVLPSVLAALVRIKAPDAADVVLAAAKEPDFVVREHAARLIGELKPAGGPDILRDAYNRAQADSAYSARAASLAALAEYGPAEATETVKAALSDKDWAVRVRAADLLAKLDPGFETRHAIRPAPGTPPAAYSDPEMAAPAYSPRVFIETAKGTIEFELAVLDAPQTSRNFINLARKGFYNGLPIHRVVPNFVVQDGDSRGDGEGGPGYTIRDELNDRPYLRGAVGMALSWRDTGGSQFFIVHSPQPHLDGLYTAFGHVVNGMEVVDRIQQGDVIERVRVWDGKTMQ
jgi:cyclophilin family peptidyl-prolyl cis-trans isomerase/HEAT repeat protein